jgi:hypothetical protein
MFVNEEAILEVARHCERTDDSASSHWRVDDLARTGHPLKDDPFGFSYGLEGLSAIGPIGAISTKTGLFFQAAHRLLQIPYRIVGRRFATFQAIDPAAASIAKRQGLRQEPAAPCPDVGDAPRSAGPGIGGRPHSRYLRRVRKYDGPNSSEPS